MIFQVNVYCKIAEANSLHVKYTLWGEIEERKLNKFQIPSKGMLKGKIGTSIRNSIDFTKLSTTKGGPTRCRR